METETISIEEQFVKWKQQLNIHFNYVYNNKLSYEKNKETCLELSLYDKHYGDVISSVKKVIQGFSKIVFIQGSPGTGKSRQIRRLLKESESDFVEITGDITEAYLYRMLYENNGKIIWMKDLVKLLKSQSALNTLKVVTESEDECLLTKSNYSKLQEDLPDKFLCECKFIFDFNTVNSPGLREDMDALISRGDFVQLNMSREDVIELMNVIAKTKKEKEITEFIINEFQNKPYLDINLRTQYKAFKTYDYCKTNSLNWKKEVVKLFKDSSKNVSMLYSIIGKEKIKTTQLKKILLKRGIVSSIRTAHRLIEKMLFLGELTKESCEERDFLIKLNI